MTTIWTLEEQGVRYTYSPSIRTFFWVDREFYNSNKEEILSWAEQFKCEVPSKQYGWVTCPNDKVTLMFILRWS